MIKKLDSETIINWKFISSGFKRKEKKDYSELIGLTFTIITNNQGEVKRIVYNEKLVDAIIENYQQRLIELFNDTNFERLSSGQMTKTLDEHRLSMNNQEKFNNHWINRLNFKNSNLIID